MTTIHYGSVEIDRLKIFYRERPPKGRYARAVLMHGFPDRGPHVGDLIPLLAEKCHIVAPDLPGGSGAGEEQPRV
jgi:pimeloyl-ACP methyl ester carboxylesterase